MRAARAMARSSAPVLLIYGGKDLSGELPDLGQAALYCVTEVHTKADIDRLAQALSEVI